MTEKLTEELAQELEVQLEVQLLINLRKLIIEQQFFFTQIENLDDEIQKIICYLHIPEHINHNDILRKLYLENYLTIVNDQINQLCQHNYVTDDIDIDPDNSMKICYCSICEKGLRPL